MALRKKSVQENVPGSFFVDETCIDCDTCRQVAPQTFHAINDHSAVYQQPTTDEENLLAAQALISCPTASIGCDDKSFISAAQHSFPLQLTNRVWYCGWTSKDSFGASSYLLKHHDQLWMIDSPRWSPALVAGIERIGQISHIFLTHQDDVADAKKYADHFSAACIIHERDKQAMPDAAIFVRGDDQHEFMSGLFAIPVPGHTAGSMALYTDHAELFSGDHVWWSPRRHALNASKGVCWEDWDQQIASMKRIRDLTFSELYPGHGRRYQTDVQSMRAQLDTLITRMQQPDPDAWP